MMVGYHPRLPVMHPDFPLDSMLNSAKAHRGNNTWEALRKDIQVNGLRNPILCAYQPHDKKAHILSPCVGWQRWMVARALHWETIPAVVFLNCFLCPEAELDPSVYERELHTVEEFRALFKDRDCPTVVRVDKMLKKGKVVFRDRVS